MTNNKDIIFPVGTAEVYHNLWYIASYFGEKRSPTWLHSGDDFNLVTGGNTDFNAPLFAIADGEILTLHTGTTGFGNMLVLKFVLNGLTYYALYCHLNGFDVKEGDIVKKGQQICRLGNSGNSKWAHLHFSIKNTANGLLNIPNNLIELKEWENPFEFIVENYGEGSETPEPAKPPESESMSKLLKWLDRSTEDDAIRDLKVLLGEFDGKCDYGNGGENRGGDLGSARRKVKKLESQPILESKEDNVDWELNGKTETVTKNGVTIVKNYAIKRGN